MGRGRKVDPNSRTQQVLEFFNRNPDEYLTYEDVAEKFNCSLQQARVVVGKLREDGALETVLVTRKAPAAV